MNTLRSTPELLGLLHDTAPVDPVSRIEFNRPAPTDRPIFRERERAFLRDFATSFDSVRNLISINVMDAPYYALANLAGDDTAAIAAAIADACALVTLGVAAVGVRVRFPRGRYQVNQGGFNITAPRVHLEGDGIYATTIYFGPAVATALFKFQMANAAQVTYQGSCRRMSFSGGGAQQKIAIDLWDCSEYTLEELTTNNWTGNSGNAATPSIALRTNGREILTTRKVDFFADRPIHIRANPNSTANETMDHFHFTDIYIAALVASEACILVDNGCVPSNLTFDGYQAWIAGKYGLDFTAGGPAIAGTIATFNNVRYEQSADATGYAFRWQGAGTQNLAFNNCHFGGAVNNGTLIRNTSRLTYNNCTFVGGAGTVAHDWTTCDQVFLINTFSQALSAVVLGTLEEVFSVPQAASGSPLPGTGYWIRPDLNAVRAMKLGGVYDYAYATSVVAGGFFTLPLLTVGNGFKVGVALIAGYSATGPIEEGGAVMATAVSTKLMGTGNTANFAVGNVGGKLCFFFNSSGNPMGVLNNTAQTLHLVVRVTAKY